jgi:aminoglycoside 3-N-acetyltransferase
MPENLPFTTRSLVEEFRRVGLFAGQVVIMHTSMKAFGRYMVGGGQAVVDALMEVITPEGTLIMPTHSADNTDPASWRNPPVPPEQFDFIRQNIPPYRPESTPTSGMGQINECFRNYPGVLRSSHPAFSFAAWGKHAEFVTANHSLNNNVAEQSPIGRIYDLDGWVCLLGVPYHNNTSLHLAEFRATWANKERVREDSASAVLVDGKREWVTYYDDAIAYEDFDDLGADFDTTGAVKIEKIGDATVRLMRQRELVDFAVTWMEQHRPASLEKHR